VPLNIVMPSMGMYTEEGVLSAWLRPSGTRVESGEAIAEITTEKVTFEIPAASAGILHQLAEVGATLRVAELLGYILAEGEAAPLEGFTSPRPASEVVLAQTISPPTPHRVPSTGGFRASPAARRLAAQHAVDLSQLQGTGPGGRIVEADVLAQVSQQEK
jgi:pyruvate dehydrogenase E2 component (dihydrolipoamide acetyltransferase)